MPFYLAFAGTVPDSRMEKKNPEGDTDHGKLCIGIATSIVYIKFIGNAIGGDGIL